MKLAPNLDIFKSRLENFKTLKFMELGNFWELSEIIFDKIESEQNREEYVDYLITGK